MGRHAGQFKPGNKANPGGRPKIPVEVKEAARAWTGEAIDCLAKIVRSGKTENARVRAAEALLNRAWGSPQASVELSVKGWDQVLAALDAFSAGSGDS